MDRRLTPANGRVAAAHLRGQVEAARFVQPAPRRIARPLADLMRAPGGARERQLVYGEGFELLEEHDGWAFGYAARDGFVGYIEAGALGPEGAPTHSVSALATHAYPAPDIKSVDICALSYGSRLRVVAQGERFVETAEGWFVPRAHLRPLDAPEDDPVALAERFLGVPYLWAGNSAWGIDCSGLVQVAWLACGRPCPGDSDLQEAALGAALAPGTRPRRGDLLFWKGHVSLAVDETRMIHANAYHMAVAYEDIAAAIARIEAQGEGPPTAHKRVSPASSR
ncbi:cell wall-associated NlpC family hydrolase [Rhodovulum iodosum]|uniref:Cell wall-associated NlpC family hydrolase n=1 Tax=Rhodovulum iodosum TaxID=68291 RepID=A0ABV3XXF8_9RHOB|nr:NlpC/P60 family protein [Rhodovulum robiginosum]RSK40219.1 NLP/P60 hydrolase [Rhodovulum robiginosum]